MSRMIVEVCEVTDIQKHPNADLIELVFVKGWTTVQKKGEYTKGQKVVYFPPDCVLPITLAERLNVTKYLKSLPQNWTPKDENENLITNFPPLAGRVASCRLRGVPSEGVLMKIDPEKGDDPNWIIGQNLVNHLNVYKWIPPFKCVDGDAERPNNRFHKYTDIESYGNFPNAIPIGTEVVFTEKLHGKNFRVGLISNADENGNQNWELMVGSHGVRRKQFGSNGVESEFWKFGATKNIVEMLNYLKDKFEWHEPKNGIIVFGELIGSGVQDMSYNFSNGDRESRIFDIAINKKYLNFDQKIEICNKFNVPTVPILYRGPFNVEEMKKYTDGPTTLCPIEKVTCKFKGREGIVVTPVIEKDSDALNGRVIIKSVSVDYRDRKNATDNQD